MPTIKEKLWKEGKKIISNLIAVASIVSAKRYQYIFTTIGAQNQTQTLWWKQI